MVGKAGREAHVKILLTGIKKYPFCVRGEVCDHIETGTRVLPIREEAVMATPAETEGVIRSLIPARIDRLPWSPTFIPDGGPSRGGVDPR